MEGIIAAQQLIQATKTLVFEYFGCQNHSKSAFRQEKHMVFRYLGCQMDAKITARVHLGKKNIWFFNILDAKWMPKSQQECI